MKVTLERLPESRMQLDIEVDQERVDKFYESAYRKLAGKARVPGFRAGKAPRAMVEKYIGRQRIMGEALDDLVPVIYNEAIEAEEIDAIDQPTLDDLALDPVRLKFSVPVRPTTELKEYRSIRVEKNTVEVTDDDIHEQVQLLRRRNATHVPVERPATWGDFLIADVVATIAGEDFMEDLDAEFALREDGILLMPGLKDAFLGMGKGDTKEVDIDIPDDFRVEAERGKTAHFALKVSEVKEEQLPDEDDELAAMVNAEEFDSLAALKERVRTDLLAQREQEAENNHRSAIIEKLVEGGTFDYPQLLVEKETDAIIREMAGNDTKQYREYLARIGRSEEDYRRDFRPVADARVKRSLALLKLAEVEGIDVTPVDIDAEIDRICEPMGEQAERFREIFNTPDGRTTVNRDLRSQRTLERLIAIARGEAPELSAAPAVPEIATEPSAAVTADEETKA